jgi:high-affinity nickel-transport protein
VGIKARWLGRLSRADTPLLIVLVGALFALSFDTMSQTALFALAGARQGGIWPTVALAVVFTGGMVTADGLNGLWISRLLARADRFAIIVSRAMGTAVGVMSLAIAVIGISCWMSPAIAAWFERTGPLLPLCALCAPLAVFLLAQRGGGQQEFLINRLEVGDER